MRYISTYPGRWTPTRRAELSMKLVSFRESYNNQIFTTHGTYGSLKTHFDSLNTCTNGLHIKYLESEINLKTLNDNTPYIPPITFNRRHC